MSSLDNEANIVSKYDGGLGKSWNLCIQQSSSRPYFNFRHSSGGNRTVFADTQINFDEWYHIAGSWDGANLNVYVNGLLENSQDESGGEINSSYSNIIIGASGEGTSGFLHGLVDEAVIWETALSEEEIQLYMSQELSGQEQGLAGYWNFNEGEGPELTDMVGNGFQGLIHGPSWSGDGAPVEPPSYGCTDSYAGNYDPDAVLDDGSCHGYPDEGNHSLNFGADADYVELSATDKFDFSDEQQLSISAYVKSLGNNEIIFQAEESYGYYIGTHNDVEFSLTM